MSKHTYVGNPGYEYPFSDGPLNPGDVVELTAEQATAAGEDFEPKTTTKPKPDASASDTED